MVSDISLHYQYDSVSKDCSMLSSSTSNSTVLDIMNLAALQGRKYCSNSQPVLYITDYIKDIGMRLIHAVVAGVEYWPSSPYNTTAEGWQLTINGKPINSTIESAIVSDRDSIVFKFGQK